MTKVPCVHGAFGLGQDPKKNLQAYIFAVVCVARLRAYCEIIYRHTFLFYLFFKEN